MSARRLERARFWSFAAGGAACAAWLAGLWTAPEAALKSYLFAYVFWLGLSLGAVALLQLHACVGGAWGRLLEETLEPAASALPWLIPLFLPIFLGAGRVYPWAKPEFLADPRVAHKRAYLNVPFFRARAAILLLVWGRQAASARAPRRAGAGLVVWSLAVSVAAIDWLMSLEPRWYSTIYGAMVGLGFIVAAFAFALAARAAIGEPEAELGKPRAAALHDAGNLLLAFLIMWAYLAFSQYLIIWSGNIPEEISWYLRRRSDAWGALAAAIWALGFFAPFLLLLSRDFKRRLRPLGAVAGLVLAARPLEAYWLVAPGGGGPHWSAAAAWIGLGGVWSGLFLTGLLRRRWAP